MTISISLAPYFTAVLASSALIAAILHPRGNPTTVQTLTWWLVSICFEAAT